MDNNPSPSKYPRVLAIGLVGVFVLLGFILVIRLTSQANIPVADQRPDALANSSDACVACHRSASPGIVQQFGHSTMAAAKVTCGDCHVVQAGYPGSEVHEGVTILKAPTAARCQRCHQAETAQYNQSRHSLPAYVAVAGSKDLSPALMAQYQAIPEGSFVPDKARNALAVLEGPEITKFACETCHSVGKPAEDGSVGRCQACHLRHEFSLEQVRKPETCNQCHIGPDHPQWEIYFESPHGIAYSTGGQRWNWDADPGTLTVKDFPAPTCAVCHMSGFGGAATTHDVGDRLTWYLFASISERRPAWQDNKVRMQTTCLSCHNKDFIDTFYTNADLVVQSVNDKVKESQAIMKPLRDQKLLTDTQFDEPIEYTEFELWHHWGRTTKFGTWMQGPDYAQWHGGYELIKALADLRDFAQQKLGAAGK
jgi:nitrate/TMAO reductase-like tetraheme cytochrome c subunit